MEELRKPLLDDDVQEDAVLNARDELDFEYHDRGIENYKEVDDVRAVWLVCSAQMEAVEETTRSKGSSSWLWSFFFGSLLPILLYIQFYTVYHLTTSTSDPLPDWSSVQGSIFLFVMTTIMYRQSASFNSTEGGENTWTSVFLFLLPDIMIDILLLLLLLRMMNVAIMTMQVCTILLAVCSILNSCTCSIRVSTASRTLTEEHDELDKVVDNARRDHDMTLAVVV